MMKSIVEVEINKPRQEVATLFADPSNNPKWMKDLKRYEPVIGDRGKPGSQYRLIPKKGNVVFLATVLSRKPDELRLNLEASNVNVSVTGKLEALSPEKTKLISEEVFTFKGLFNSILGLFAGKSIKSVHRRHIEDFKQFAERS
jgi:uncharacterized membrane protein